MQGGFSIFFDKHTKNEQILTHLLAFLLNK